MAKLKWHSEHFKTIAHSNMVHTWVSDKCKHFALMYTTDQTLPVLPIKHLVNQDGEPTTPHKLETGTKPSVSNLRLLFCPWVVQKSTAHIDTKALNMRHQSQAGFCGIFVWIPKHQKWYLIYVYSTHNIMYSHDVVSE